MYLIFASLKKRQKTRMQFFASFKKLKKYENQLF
eukprot:UN08308